MDVTDLNTNSRPLEPNLENMEHDLDDSIKIVEIQTISLFGHSETDDFILPNVKSSNFNVCEPRVKSESMERSVMPPTVEPGPSTPLPITCEYRKKDFCSKLVEKGSKTLPDDCATYTPQISLNKYVIEESSSSNLNKRMKVESEPDDLDMTITEEITIEDNDGNDYNLDTNKIGFVCKQCQLYFWTRFDFTNHLNMHNSKKSEKYYCVVTSCQKSFSNKLDLREHSKSHPKVGFSPTDFYGCTYCGGKFVSKKILFEHIARHLGRMPHECNHCGRIFRSKSYMMKHVFKVHSGKILYSCKPCVMVFPDKLSLEKHAKLHSLSTFSVRHQTQGRHKKENKPTESNIPKVNVPEINISGVNVPSPEVEHRKGISSEEVVSFGQLSGVDVSKGKVHVVKVPGGNLPGRTIPGREVPVLKFSGGKFLIAEKIPGEKNVQDESFGEQCLTKRMPDEKQSEKHSPEKICFEENLQNGRFDLCSYCNGQITPTFNLKQHIAVHVEERRRKGAFRETKFL